MTPPRLATVTAALLICLQTPAMSANFAIDNPASNIYNPAAHMDNPSPISPASQAIPAPPAITKEIAAPLPVEKIKVQPQPQPKPTIPNKNYHFKTVNAYIVAAKKAFNRDNHMEFVSITEDALRRINAGTLRASKISKQKLLHYKTFGYGLLVEDE